MVKHSVALRLGRSWLSLELEPRALRRVEVGFVYYKTGCFLGSPARQTLSPGGVTELKFGVGKVGPRVRAGDVPFQTKGVPAEPTGSSIGAKFPLRGVDAEAAGTLFCREETGSLPFYRLTLGDLEIDRKQHNLLVDFPRMLSHSAAGLCRFFLLL